MADCLDRNRKAPLTPDEVFCGQGWLQIITPLLHGFPGSGALARIATNIKASTQTSPGGSLGRCLRLDVDFNNSPVRDPEQVRAEERAAEDSIADLLAQIDRRSVPFKTTVEERSFPARFILCIAAEEGSDQIVATKGHRRTAAVLFGRVATPVTTESPAAGFAVEPTGVRTELFRGLEQDPFGRQPLPKSN